jgi:CO/xanthine dehydrogenase Mo-binding subunit
MAVGFWRGATNTSSCTLTLNVDGSFNLTVGSVDITGSKTSLRQICAEFLQVPPEEIYITTGDSDTVGHTDNSSGSRITYTMGTAIHRACQDLINQLKERAALRLRVSPDMVEYGEKRFWARDIPEKVVTLQELALASIKGEGALVARGVASRMKFAPAFSLHIADVEVDPETGKVRLLNSTAFQDAGCIVNPDLVEGQVHGAVTQAIGWALMEELSFDERGILLNPTLLDYRMPTAVDVPMFQTDIIEVPASDGPLGVRGVGEVGIVPPPAAIANAIYRAVGVRIRELPMSAEQVFWALKRR